MPEINAYDEIISLLAKFLKGELYQIPQKTRKKTVILHYYMEVIRFWNKINFMLSYTLSALGNYKKVGMKEKALFSLIIYMREWEKMPLKDILNKFQKISRRSEGNFTKKHIIEFSQKLNTFSWKKALSNKSRVEKDSINKAVPSFFIETLLPYMQRDFLVENIEKMNAPRELSIGIVMLNSKKSANALKAEVKQYLSNINISFKDDPYISSMIQISSENIAPILKSTFYKEGDILILDIGSAYIANFVAKQKGKKFLDMCAAPGIKTILLSELVESETAFIAADFSGTRISEMRNFLQFLKIPGISVLNTDSINFPLRDPPYFDIILLDAPCTGSGTFSSNPELKWRQNPSFLHQNTTLQEKLLRSAINMLKPAGILVYSTCSLYAEEGEMQIMKVMDKLIPLDLPEFFSSSYTVNRKSPTGTGRLFPAVHNSKGFFIGTFIKR